MAEQATFKARKREGAGEPAFGTLGERAGQGGRQHYPCSCASLAERMGQGEQPLHMIDKDHPPKLGEEMRQR